MADSRVRSGTELKIGDLERRTGVSRSSIQHYVRLKVITPPRKLGPKLFLFDERHVEELARLRMLRERDKLPLKEIRAQLRSPDAWSPFSMTVAHVPKHDQARRDAILEVATRSFVQLGYEGVRLSDIAAEIGLSKAALYQSFDSKEALFVECIERIRLMVVPARAREGNKRVADPAQRALQRVKAVLHHIEAYRMLTRLLESVSQSRDRDIASRAREAFHAMVTDVVPELRQAVRAGLFRDTDLELHAYLMWGALMGAGDYMSFVAKRPPDFIARTYLELMIMGTLPANARGVMPR